MNLLYRYGTPILVLFVQPISGQGCETFRESLKLDAADYAGVQDRYQALHQSLIETERSCQSLGAQLAFASANRAETRGCEAQTDNEHLQNEQLNHSERCQLKFFALQKNIQKLEADFAKPLDLGAQATHTSLRRDPILLQRCGAELRTAANQAGLTSGLLTAIVLDANNSGKNVTSFTSLSAMAKKLRERSMAHRAGCVGMRNASVALTRSPPGSATGSKPQISRRPSSGRSDITGVERKPSLLPISGGPL